MTLEPITRLAEPVRKRRKGRWILAVTSGLLLAVTAVYIVVPQYKEAVGILGSLERVSLPLLAAAVVAELASFAAYSALTVSVLGKPHPGYFTQLRIDVANLGLNHIIPGGGATAAAVRVRWLVRSGVRPARALAGSAIQITGSNLVLGAVFMAGLVLSLTSVARSDYYRTAAGAALALLLCSAAAIWVLVWHTERAIPIGRAISRRLPFIKEDAIVAFIRMIANQLRKLLSSPRLLIRDALFSIATWLLDATALAIMLAAFGHPVSLGPLLTVYGVGSILGTLPLTPGGLGLVEGVMVPALISFGTQHQAALLGVLGWRLLEFWLPIPLGGLAYLSLSLGRSAFSRRPRQLNAAAGNTVESAG